VSWCDIVGARWGREPRLTTLYVNSDLQLLGSHVICSPPDVELFPAVQVTVCIVPPEAEDDCTKTLARGCRWRSITE
jgi:hypothetical protein